ncbi:fumarylacetoacetate hydrolase family protein [Aquirufa aurantiipilula]|uniref:Fumarylacetoacetate hydrolase family protein n=1 Tax=Aquirufa aurantiipilula TaxID=2696561 RepID=A0ABT6BGX2_9BACT|nr:fumarylacetoacetate hydrolase family protein [Aquirufa aurantiipilula]MBZ1325504.1 fumarylacetoacetate hydrolase family protein [Aquirufa aurantiipilula]MDF5689706.1 fumarylacetoacetate hydrolase family protein [Aquirufa aurantiipilula]
MKLVRLGDLNKEKPAVLIDGKYFDVSAYFQDFNEAFFEEGGIEKLADIVKNEILEEISHPQRIGSCVARPSKIICVGLNYADHAKETGAAIPTEPILFFKSTSALSGPYDDVIIPKNSVKTDWEVEFAIVIGKKASYVSEETAYDYVAGYCLHNDVSEREFQLERGGNWSKGKGCDTFAPLGPFLATKDEIQDVHNLNMWLDINGKRFQTSNTKQLIFNVPQIVSYISQFMTLLPGDVISTGTPHGVGLGLNPPVFLKPGDVMTLGMDGLGEQKQKAIAYSA